MSATTALLLVDCQQDYLARDGLLPSREVLVEAIAAALAQARARGWPVVHVRTRVAADGSDAMPHRRAAPEAVAGTAGAEPPAALRERDGEPVFHKRFFSAFDADGLEKELRRRGVTRLLVAGVHGHACIQASVTDAYARGFEIAIAEDLVGSDDPAASAQALRWLDGRAGAVTESAAILGTAPAPWQHRNPCDWSEVLGEVAAVPPGAIAAKAERLRQVRLPPPGERAERLRRWHELLGGERGRFTDALVRDLGKPRRDAEGEVAYGLALLDAASVDLGEEESSRERRVRYRPHGIAGLITPWNNPFAIPLAKLAPALGHGNAALWKPALAGSGIAALLHDSLERAGLADHVALVTGDAATGRAVLAEADCLSFTGCVAVGRLVVAEAARRGIPVQAELGGSNAAIVDSSADLDSAAADLAAAMFSFAGQRCTAIRRLIVVDSIADAFVERLAAEVAALRIGDPADAATQIGPVIDQPSQLAWSEMARGPGKRLAGGQLPAGLAEQGCWVAPAVLSDLPDGHPLLIGEVFGPLAAVIRAASLEEAIAIHNATAMGLLGALFSRDEGAQASFLAGAQAGMLSLNRARPAFAADGPFVGWKASSYGIAEHGRWNRDFYTRPQAIYGDGAPCRAATPHA